MYTHISIHRYNHIRSYWAHRLHQGLVALVQGLEERVGLARTPGNLNINFQNPLPQQRYRFSSKNMFVIQ